MVMLRTLVKNIKAYSQKMNKEHSAFRSEGKKKTTTAIFQKKKTHCWSENIFFPYFNINISKQNFHVVLIELIKHML